MVLKEFEIGFDMKYSHTVHVKAKNKTEAKQKGFKMFQKIANRRSEYNIYAEEI